MLAEAAIGEGVEVGVRWDTGCSSADETAVGQWARIRFGGTRT